MARRERLLDPAEGPLQEFAYDLRRVRAAAGNPTYRALARTAGYSATTLSEAARGERKPTLDVVLAYVGACRGDAQEWQRRWQELDAPPPTGPGSALASASPSSPPSALPSAQASALPSAPPKRTPLLLVAAAALLVLAAVVAARWPDNSDKTSATAPACPRQPATRAFTGETYGGGAPVRSGASPGDPVVSTVASHCTLGFTGFCLGASMRDATSHTPDVRWFILSDGTVVPSAIIHGNPPAKLQPSHCRNDRPAPTEITLTVTAGASGDILASASGDNVEIAGFAARTAGKWQQLALTDDTTLRATWHPSAGPAVVVAAACLGGGRPTDAVDARLVPGDHTTLSHDDRTAAARAACQYPHS